MRKFEENGEKGLANLPGYNKPLEERTPEDELRLKIQQMEREMMLFLMWISLKNLYLSTKKMSQGISHDSFFKLFYFNN